MNHKLHIFIRNNSDNSVIHGFHKNVRPIHVGWEIQTLPLYSLRVKGCTQDDVYDIIVEFNDNSYLYFQQCQITNASTNYHDNFSKIRFTENKLYFGRNFQISDYLLKK